MSLCHVAKFLQMRWPLRDDTLHFSKYFPCTQGWIRVFSQNSFDRHSIEDLHQKDYDDPNLKNNKNEFHETSEYFAGKGGMVP